LSWNARLMSPAVSPLRILLVKLITLAAGIAQYVQPMLAGMTRARQLDLGLILLHIGNTAVRTTANAKTATAKTNATTRTRRCSNFPEALAKKSTVANSTVFARY
jgi:hypothetical protein